MTHNHHRSQFAARTLALPATTVPHQPSQVPSAAGKGDTLNIPINRNIPTIVRNFECSPQAQATRCTSNSFANKEYLRSSEIDLSTSSVTLSPFSASPLSSSSSSSSSSSPFFNQHHNNFHNHRSVLTHSPCSYQNSSMSQVTVDGSDRYSHARRDERSLMYTDIDDYNKNNNNSSNNNVNSVDFPGSNDNAFSKKYHTLTVLGPSPFLRSTEDVKFNPTDLNLRLNKPCTTNPTSSYSGSHGKLPAFSDLTSQLRHSMTPTEDWLAECSPLGSDVSMSSPNNSRSSSCSTDYDDEDDGNPLLNLVNFDLAADFKCLDEPLLSDVNVMDHALIKTEPTDPYFAEDIVAMTHTVMSEFCFPSSEMLSEFSDSDGYESCYEQPGGSSLPPPLCYYEPLGDSSFQLQQLPGSYGNVTVSSASSSAEYPQTSPETDEGFVDEPNMPENLPHFDKIQFSTSAIEEQQHPVPNRRPSSSSPKVRRKMAGSPQEMTSDKERRKPGRKPGQVSNVLHLWEFMRDLLHSPDSKGIIEWISKPEGVFRVVDSSQVAKLWGKKKKNKKEMTYEKLSRSLRYSRLEGYFSNLPKDKNYPKKLCFKFGPKSRDWY